MVSRLPAIDVIVDALRHSDAPGTELDPAGAGSKLIGPVVALHHNNVAQWKREDDARLHDTDVGIIAAVKRDIDVLNTKRHVFIEEIDRLIFDMVEPRPSAPLATESPGLAIDRLSVLVIRLESVEARAAAGPPEVGDYAQRVSRVRHQLDALTWAIGALFSDLETGARSFYPYESLKLYGSGACGEGDRA